MDRWSPRVGRGVAQERAALNSSKIEALVRNIILQRRLPFAMRSVAASPAGWDIEVDETSGGIRAFTVASGRPLAIRFAIQEHLEAELE